MKFTFSFTAPNIQFLKMIFFIKYQVILQTLSKSPTVGGTLLGPLTFVALLINLRDSFRMMTLDFYEKNFFLPILLQYCNHVNKGLFLLLLTFLQRW